jgi:hypothetical protein
MDGDTGMKTVLASAAIKWWLVIQWANPYYAPPTLMEFETHKLCEEGKKQFIERVKFEIDEARKEGANIYYYPIRRAYCIDILHKETK